MNSDIDENNIIELNITSKQNLEHQLLPQTNLIKFHSAIVGHKNQEVTKRKSFDESNKLGDSENLNVMKSSEFKLIWLLQNFTKMSLDMNTCYIILQKTNLEEDISLEMVFNNILNEYFAEKIAQEDAFDQNENKNIANKAKNILISKIFFREKQQMNINEGKEEKAVVIDIENKKEDDIAQPKLKCIICYEDHLESNYFKNEKINHDICSFCLVNYVKQKIFTNEILKIKCPDDCGMIFDENDIKFILQNQGDTFSKYLKFKNIATINQDPFVIWCVKVDCPGYIKGEKNSKKLACPLCNQEICFLCRNAWHEGRNCEEAMNSEFISYVKKVEAKDCPKCKSKIEKFEGCNHMTCARCKYNFCWICLGKYSSNHYEWYNVFGCPKMQYSRMRYSSVCSKCRWILIFFKIIIFILFVLLCIAGCLIAYAVCPPFFAIKLPFDYKYKTWKKKIKNKCFKVVYPIIFTLGVILLLPITTPLLYITGPCVLAFLIISIGDDD